MHCSERGLRLIEEFEGGQAADGLFHAYWDRFGQVWTIGYGETHGVTQNMVWTKAQAEQDLRERLARDFEPAVNALGVELNRNQFDALCSYLWNCGPLALEVYGVAPHIRCRDWHGAAQALLHPNTSGGVVLPGLVRRRAAESALFLEPPPIDPYARFNAAKRHLLGREFSEIEVVKEYDQKRKRPKLHRRRLRRLRDDCGVLAARLEAVKALHHDHWDADQQWRYDQLVGRERGRRYA